MRQWILNSSQVIRLMEACPTEVNTCDGFLSMGQVRSCREILAKSEVGMESEALSRELTADSGLSRRYRWRNVKR